ncbi:MAG: LysR family transcriptional regulator [Rhizobacter sp.]|nr:LysR family transcriptional regulator [Rhizobacter sp.]
MDRLQAMRTFVRVIDEGSFAAAARALNVSPAVVTRLVAELEEHLGARLINRTTRRLALTETGESYLDRVRHILGDVDDAEALAGAATAEARGTVRVVCSPAFAVHQLAKHLPAFRARHPKVSVELTVPGPVETVDDNFDVTILTEGRRPLEGGFIARRLARSEVIACAAPEYLDRRGRPQHPRELVDHEALLPSSLREITFHTLAGGSEAAVGESYTVMPQSPALRTVHTDTLYAAALAGMGITGLPSFVAEDALLEHALERVLPRWHTFLTTIYAGLPTRKHVPARTPAFVDFLVEVFGGEDRDPWLLAAGCETPEVLSLPQRRRVGATG